jgi:hypothetical protein
MEAFTWKSHPARERPVAMVFVVIFCLIIFYSVYHFTHSPLMVITSVVILTISLATFFFPTTYTIFEGKVKIKYLFTEKERNMTAFRAVYAGQRGVLLSPYISPTRMENFRGFYLRYGQDNKAEVDQFLNEYLEWQTKAIAERQKPEVNSGN